MSKKSQYTYLLIDQSIYVFILFFDSYILTWLYITWQACVAINETNPRRANKQSRICTFLIRWFATLTLEDAWNVSIVECLLRSVSGAFKGNKSDDELCDDIVSAAKREAISAQGNTFIMGKCSFSCGGCGNLSSTPSTDTRNGDVQLLPPPLNKHRTKPYGI